VAVDRSARDTYLENVDPRFVPLVTELDRLVRAARPELTVAIKYRLLTYAVGSDFRYWICAIGAGREAVSLRFLYGAGLDAPRGTLRPGSTTMGTLDYTSLEQVDAGLVADLVGQAVDRLPQFKVKRPARHA
jgi:hypothetical protein